MPKHQKVDEVATAPKEIVHITNERFSYPFGAKPTESDSSINAVHYKPNSNRLEQMAEHKAVKEKHEATLNKDWKEDGQLPANLKDHQPSFLKLVEEFESMWDVNLRCINVAKYRTDPLNHDVRPARSAPY